MMHRQDQGGSQEMQRRASSWGLMAQFATFLTIINLTISLIV